MSISGLQYHIQNGALGGYTTPSSLALPGQNLPATYMLCDFYLDAYIADNLDVSMRINSGYARQNHISGPAVYPVELRVSKIPFGYVGSPPQPNIGGTVTLTPIPLPEGSAPNSGTTNDMTITFSTGNWVNIGNLRDFTPASSSGPLSAYVYVGGSAIYNVTNPLGDIVAFPCLLQDILRYLDYFPARIWDGATWQSCNRPTGKFRKFTALNAWTDRKNMGEGTATELAENDDTVRMWSGTNWNKAKKIGANA